MAGVRGEVVALRESPKFAGAPDPLVGLAGLAGFLRPVVVSTRAIAYPRGG